MPGRAESRGRRSVRSPSSPSAPSAEAGLQRAVIDLARLLGYRVAHFRSVNVLRANGTTAWQTPVQADGRGFPDLVIAGRGRIIFAELKSQRGKATPEQEGWLELLRSCGAEAYLWTPRDWDQIEEVLRSGRPG